MAKGGERSERGGYRVRAGHVPWTFSGLYSERIRSKKEAYISLEGSVDCEPGELSTGGVDESIRSEIP